MANQLELKKKAEAAARNFREQQQRQQEAMRRAAQARAWERQQRMEEMIGKIIVAVFLVLAVAGAVLACVASSSIDNTLLLLGKIGFVCMAVCPIIAMLILFFKYDAIGFLSTVAAIWLIGGGVIALMTWSGIWHGDYSISDSGVIYYEEGGSIVVSGVQEGHLEVIINESYEGLEVVTIDLGKAEEVTDLTIFAENLSHKITKDFFNGCTKLENLTFIGGKLTLNSNALRDLHVLESVSFESGEYILKANTFNGCSALEQIRVIDAAVTCGTDETSTGTVFAFSDCSSFDMIIENGTLNYFADDVDRLTLGGECHINFCLHRGMLGSNEVEIKQVIFENDFDFEHSDVANCYNVGLVNVDLRYIPLGKEIYLPETCTRIMDNLFGDEGEACRLYYEGLEEQLYTLPNRGFGNQNLDSGKVDVWSGASLEDIEK